MTDAYATEAEYRARAAKSDTADDATILAQLKAAARYVDIKMGRFFTQEAAVTRIYDGDGSCRIWIDDIVSVATLKVDLDGDYLFSDETALTLDTDYWLGPVNAADGSEAWPFEYIEVHPTSTRLSSWPRQRRAIEIVGTFGWPAVPGPIREATISIVRQLRDMQESGFTLVMQDIESAVNASPQMSALLLGLQRVYAKPSPF